MQVGKFIEYNNRFGLTGILNPVLGGPYSSCGYVIRKGETREEVLARFARNVEYVAVRPFESLDLQATNAWQLHKRMAQWHVRDTLTFNRGVTAIYPNFQGDGIVYAFIGSAGWRRMDERYSANWAAVDQTPLLDVIRMVKAEYDGRKLEHFERWALQLVMRIGWKATNPKRRSYDIYLPPPEFLKEHGVEVKERQLTGWELSRKVAREREQSLSQFAEELAGI